MKILLLSRPIINAGDFLFSEKSLEAFQTICPDTVVECGHVSNAYDLDYLNRFAAIVVAGGPLYDNKFLQKDSFPLLEHIKDLRPRIHFLANGWYGADAELNSIYNYRFDREVAGNLSEIQKRGGTFSCRDYITETILRRNGLDKVTMTGCTAWFDYDKFDCMHPAYNLSVERIIISDQGITKDKSVWEWKYWQMEALIALLKKIFPIAKLMFTFNGGIHTKYSRDYNLRICDLLKKHNVVFYDISGRSSGFALCQKADLHVGFRMHSHIYCMSKRIPSILIAEDARGVGFNNSVGLRDIRDFAADQNGIHANPFMTVQVEDYLRDLVSCEFLLLKSAYETMRIIYEHNFVPFVKGVCGYDKGRADI